MSFMDALRVAAKAKETPSEWPFQAPSKSTRTADFADNAPPTKKAKKLSDAKQPSFKSTPLAARVNRQNSLASLSPLPRPAVSSFDNVDGEVTSAPRPLSKSKRQPREGHSPLARDHSGLPFLQMSKESSCEFLPKSASTQDWNKIIAKSLRGAPSSGCKERSNGKKRTEAEPSEDSPCLSPSTPIIKTEKLLLTTLSRMPSVETRSKGDELQSLEEILNLDMDDGTCEIPVPGEGVEPPVESSATAMYTAAANDDVPVPPSNVPPYEADSRNDQNGSGQDAQQSVQPADGICTAPPLLDIEAVARAATSSLADISPPEDSSPSPTCPLWDSVLASAQTPSMPNPSFSIQWSDAWVESLAGDATFW